MVSQPQFLLFCDARASNAISDRRPATSQLVFGRWQFALERLDRHEKLEAADTEESIHPDRLALLSVVRGLEALEQPSRVKLVTTSRYVSRGLKYGLSTWRESEYQWERFGVQKPVRNADLWRRVDHALRYHGVSCRLIESAAETSGTQSVSRIATTPSLANAKDKPASGKLPACHDEQQSQCSVALQGNNYLRRPTLVISNRFLSDFHLVDWWDLALSWIRWWRGRAQAAPAVSGA